MKKPDNPLDQRKLTSFATKIHKEARRQFGDGVEIEITDRSRHRRSYTHPAAIPDLCENPAELAEALEASLVGVTSAVDQAKVYTRFLLSETTEQRNRATVRRWAEDTWARDKVPVTVDWSYGAFETKGNREVFRKVRGIEPLKMQDSRVAEIPAYLAKTRKALLWLWKGKIKEVLVIVTSYQLQVVVRTDFTKEEAARYYAYAKTLPGTKELVLDWVKRHTTLDTHGDAFYDLVKIVDKRVRAAIRNVNLEIPCPNSRGKRSRAAKSKSKPTAMSKPRTPSKPRSKSPKSSKKISAGRRTKSKSKRSGKAASAMMV